jgi:hypothetical protein
LRPGVTGRAKRTLARGALLAAAWLLLPAPAAPQAAPAPASLADLAWFEGHWVDRSEAHLSEEIWTAPSGDSMVGVWRLVIDGKLRISEILAITAEPDGPTMRLRHFDPKLIGREEKDRPVVFRLVAWKPREAVFEGPGVNGEGLVRLSYRRPTDDTLVAILEKGGKAEEFRYRLARP